MKQLHMAVKALYHLAFPDLCSACYTGLVSQEKMLCTACLSTLPKTNFQDYSMNEVAKVLYGKFYYNRAAALYYFNKVSRMQRILHEVKYKQNEELGVYMGEQMAVQLLEGNWLSGIDTIIPIPISFKKQKQRGYNQSELLATGIHCKTSIPVDTTSIIRSKNTQTQTKKSIQQRLDNVSDAFQVVTNHTLKGKHILLLDDVITTGATIESCAKELLKISGTEVSVLTLAYAVR